MGTAVALASIHTSTIKLSPGERAFWYWLVWVVSIIGIAIVLWAALRSKRWARWTTQDILIVAALGVLLEVYDNIIGDQFIGPLIAPIPGADFTQVQDLPYMFLLMVGVALVRKPGCVTAMVFVNFLLAQLLGPVRSALRRLVLLPRRRSESPRRSLSRSRGQRHSTLSAALLSETPTLPTCDRSASTKLRPGNPRSTAMPLESHKGCR